jgi:hypothetical protein
MAAKTTGLKSEQAPNTSGLLDDRGRPGDPGSKEDNLAKMTAPKRTKAGVKKGDAAKATNATKAANAGDEDRVVFPDPGFHIAVLGALLDQELVDQEKIEAKLQGIEGEDEFDRLRTGMARLHAIKLARRKIEKIERLDFDGGNEIYMVLEEGADIYTGGEDDTYALRSLEGIGALTGLQTLNLDGHGYREETLDLRPLQGHPALATLTLTGKCSHAAILETLPKLAKIDLRYGKVDNASVLDRLAARGVEIQR